jgi:hypothetical protein
MSVPLPRLPPRQALAVSVVSIVVIVAASLVPPAPVPGEAGAAVDGDVGEGAVGPGSGTSALAGPPVADPIDRLHVAGVTGRNVTVGIVDVTGFDTGHPALADRVAAARSFAPGTGVRNGGRDAHGTAAAVTVARTAPDAQLYLATFDGEAPGAGESLARAVTWLVRQDADVVIAPVAAYGVADDGGSPVARAAARARAAGAVVLAPTGNLARGHWEGRVAPTTAGRHRFAAGRSVTGGAVERVGAASRSDVDAAAPAGPAGTLMPLRPADEDGTETAGRLTVWLSVDRPGSDAELSVAVYRLSDEATRAGDDTDIRSGVGAGGDLGGDGRDGNGTVRTGVLRAAPDGQTVVDPEAATLVAASRPAAAGEVPSQRLSTRLRPGEHVLVVRTDAGEPVTPRPTPVEGAPDADATSAGTASTAGARFEVSSTTHALAAPRPAGSVAAPSTAPAVVAVGAAGPDGEPAGYSSRGPTDDGRLGVDVLAPTDRWPGPEAGADGRGGTSAAAAYAGGVTALVRAAAPGLSAPRVRSVLRGTAVDAGPPGPDAAAGHGRLAPVAAVRRAGRLDGDPTPLGRGNGTVVARDGTARTPGNATTPVDVSPAGRRPGASRPRGGE